MSYNGSLAQTIETTVGNTAITTLGTLTIDGSGAKTLEGNLTVNDNLDMQGTATFADGGNTLTYGSSAVLTYGGGATQTTGDELTGTIEGLVINNASDINLNSDVTVNDDINFTSGMIILGTNDVIANAISGYDQDKYFVTDGAVYLERIVGASATVDFPVGISTNSQSNLVQLTPGDLSTFQVRVSATFSNAPNDASRVADTEWNINRTAGSAATKVRLSWRDDGTLHLEDHLIHQKHKPKSEDGMAPAGKKRPPQRKMLLVRTIILKLPDIPVSLHLELAAVECHCPFN